MMHATAATAAPEKSGASVPESIRGPLSKFLWKLLCATMGTPDCTKPTAHSYYVRKSLSEQRSTFSVLVPSACDVRPNPVIQAGVESGILQFPEGAEHWFVIPHWSLVASDYPKAVKYAFELYRTTCGYQVRCGESGENANPFTITEYREKSEFMNQLMKNQRSGMVIFAAQFGQKRQGFKRNTVRNALASDEHALGAYEILMMLVANPGRMGFAKDLGIECSGDEYERRSGHYDRGTLQLRHEEGSVVMQNHFDCGVVPNMGSPTAFAPTT